MIDEVVNKFLDIIRPDMKQIKDMYLFGSRCRDDWRPDSDYDILIVIEKKDRLLKDNIYNAVIDILLSTGRLISLKIFTVSEFERLRSIPTPFIENVTTEGIRLGTYH
jgi:predicted nucleotidyltransferase